jgi:hypothetical protein
MAPDEIEGFIQAHPCFAKTMAYISHSYVVKQTCRDPTEFERFVMHIRQNGYRPEIRAHLLHLFRLAG